MSDASNPMGARRVIHALRVNADRDAEWLAALREWNQAGECACLEDLLDVAADVSESAHEACSGCERLRALLKRAMATRP